MAGETLLIVDDNPVDLRVARAHLGRAGYEVIAATSGQEALSLVRANTCFDLILLDVIMPGLDGVNVCRALKNNEATKHIPIILVSGLRTEDVNIQRGLEAGADGYLTKPVSQSELKAWVHAALRFRKLERRLQDTPEYARTGADLQETVSALSQAVMAPLQTLTAKAELLGEELSDRPQAKEKLKEIVAQAEKAAEMVANASLLARAKRQQAT
jgi:CheY-like chemotaxis protein